MPVKKKTRELESKPKIVRVRNFPQELLCAALYTFFGSIFLSGMRACILLKTCKISSKTEKGLTVEGSLEYDEFLEIE